MGWQSEEQFRTKEIQMAKNISKDAQFQLFFEKRIKNEIPFFTQQNDQKKMIDC